MNLRLRLLLLFGATVLGGMAVLYFVTRSLLLESFAALETEQIKQNLTYAATAVEEENSQLGTITSDYAYWDRVYGFMGHPHEGEIGSEFQDGTMDGLKLDLIVLRDSNSTVAFEKYYDSRTHRAAEVPEEFLNELFARPEMALTRLAAMPRDGLLDFPDGPYFVSIRPILNSGRTGEPRGIFLSARHFDAARAARVDALYRASLEFQRVQAKNLSAGNRVALASMKDAGGSSYVRPIDQNSIAGYTILNDVFDQPLLLLHLESSRPIYERGKLSQLYLFATVCLCTVLSSLVIFFLFQKFVLARLGSLNHQVTSIGKRKAISERVVLEGEDELCSLAVSINGMLKELERTQSHFLFLTENIHQIFWVKDARSGRYESVSNAFQQIVGRPSDSALRDPNSWKELVLPEDLFLVQRMEQQQARGEGSEAYFRLNSADGTVKWLWERFFPTFAPDGQLLQIIGLTEDVSEFKRHEEALLRAQQELEVRVQQRTRELAERGELINLLVNSTPVAMYGMDSDGKLTFCNPAALRLLGYDHSSEVLGKNSHSLIHHSRPDGSPYPLSECPIFVSFRDGSDTRVADEVFWKKDGTCIPVEYESRQIRRAGRVVGVVVSFEDVTLRKLQELEERHSQKLEAVGRLAAGIAHEINTPIQFIGDNTRFLQDSFVSELKLMRVYEQLRAAAALGPVNPKLFALLDATRREVEWDYLQEEIPRALAQNLEGLGRVSTIVRGMKEFSHVDRSNEKSPSDLNRALESTLIVARNELKYFADVQTDFSEIPLVICNLGDINQVFLNLLVNASHAIEDVVKDSGKKGKITLRTKLDGDCVLISISDDGTGIPEEARGKIFDPFFTTKTVGRGSGQGLALARAIVVEKHGGTLSFETEAGKGTTFTIRLPVSGSAVREEALVP